LQDTDIEQPSTSPAVVAMNVASAPQGDPDLAFDPYLGNNALSRACAGFKWHRLA
jgi:hypothetical protein